MRNSFYNTRPEAEISRMLSAGARGHEWAVIDPMTLASLDKVLFRCLEKIGTPKERVCSALCLSYAEYDYISGQLNVR